MTFWMTYAVLVVIGVLGILAAVGLWVEIVRDWIGR